jgi:hypothetical protein
MMRRVRIRSRVRYTCGCGHRWIARAGRRGACPGPQCSARAARITGHALPPVAVEHSTSPHVGHSLGGAPNAPRSPRAVKCLRCGYEWTPRTVRPPSVCPAPSCKSRDWRTPSPRPRSQPAPAEAIAEPAVEEPYVRPGIPALPTPHALSADQVRAEFAASMERQRKAVETRRAAYEALAGGGHG